MSHNLWLSIAPTHGHIHVHHISLTVLLNINCVWVCFWCLVGWLILNFWGRLLLHRSGASIPSLRLPQCYDCVRIQQPWLVSTSLVLCVYPFIKYCTHRIDQHNYISVYFLPNLLLFFSMAIPLLFHIDFSSTVGGGESSCWKLVEIAVIHLFAETWSFHCCLSAGTWLASQFIYAFFPLLGVLKTLAPSSIHLIGLYLIFHFIKDLCFCPCMCVLV